MRKHTIIIAAALLAGCANYRPLIDTHGADMSNYEADLAACQNYARSVNPAAGVAGGAVTGAAVMSAVGAIAGAFVGEAGEGAALGAALGGAQGSVLGGAQAAEDQQTIIRNCLAGRGYRVLK